MLRRFRCVQIFLSTISNPATGYENQLTHQIRNNQLSDEEKDEPTLVRGLVKRCRLLLLRSPINQSPNDINLGFACSFDCLSYR